MAITKLKHHDNCEVYVQLERYKIIGHYASLRCKNHNTWIQWLHKWDVENFKNLGVKVEVRKKKLLTLEEAGLI